MLESSMKQSMGVMRLVIVLLLVVGGIYLSRLWVASPTLPKELRGDEFKAVFLQNGQVYFGKIGVASKDFIKINEPFYFQTRTVLQEPVEEGQQPQRKQQVSLTALGGPGLQLHGPEKSMFVPWDTILFMENLREDSEVVKLIEKAGKPEEKKSEEGAKPAEEKPTETETKK